MMKRNRPAFPVNTEMKDKDGTLFTNTVVGGLTVRDYVAIEFVKGMVSNPGFVSVGHMNLLVDKGFELADYFIQRSGET